VGALSRVRNAQTAVLDNVLGTPRFTRLVEQEAIDGQQAYTASELLASVRKGVWKELDDPQVRIDAYRRNLQHAYLDLVNNKLNRNGAGEEERPFYRAELRSLADQINASMAKTRDGATKAHLEGARDQIAAILDPKFAPPTGGGGIVLRIGLDGADPEICWPDYSIEP
jgi:hypothetical protein